MHRKKVLLVAGAVLVAVLLLGALGAAVVFAQEPEPETEAGTEVEHPPRLPFGRLWGPGRGLFGFGGQWAAFDAVAETLEMTPTALFEELHAGKTLEEIAEAQGVEIEAIREALQATHDEAMRSRIAEAVQNGDLSQEQADWLLEGLDQGFLPRARGFGHGFGRGGHRGFMPSRPGEVEPESETENTSQISDWL